MKGRAWRLAITWDSPATFVVDLEPVNCSSRKILTTTIKSIAGVIQCRSVLRDLKLPCQQKH